MKVESRFEALAQFSMVPPLKFSFFFFCMVFMLFANTASAQVLDPNLPPGGNFDLSYWKITRPNQQERDADQLAAGFMVNGEFYTDTNTGAMVFWCPNDGATGGSTYPRNELREMIRRFDTSIPTQGINKNNWVFSSSTMANQEAAGGVDGVLTATVAVDHVSETSDQSFKIGRTIVGQIHASDDEPCRLYYRKLPGNTRGSIYFAHEPITGAEQWYDMIGSRNDGISDPADGVALGEKFSYEIKVVGNTLTVTIMRDGKPDVTREVDMTNSGFADDWMYFKAGNYNQNNAGDSDEYAQVSFFALDVTHSAPIPPTGFVAPSDIPRFQPFLADCKLQAPTSSTIADKNRLNGGYINATFFKVVNGDKIFFSQTGESKRTELRNETNWDLTTADRSLHGRVDIVEQTCDQVTVMQIHDDANAGNGPNKPLLRIYKHFGRTPTNHIWAAIKTDDGGVATTHYDLGEDPGGYFNCDVRLVNGNMIIDFEGEEKVNVDVSFWTYPSYWKAGVYLQDDGLATAHFDDLFEGDGSPQNYAPSVSITSPANGANFLPGTNITITADANDSDGSISKVEFFEGGVNKLGEDLTEPYSFDWQNVVDGDYTITVQATDNEGVVKTSLSTNIRVGEVVGVTGIDLANIGALNIGSTVELRVSVLPADATNQNVIFESDDPSVATVSSDGLVTSLALGSTMIRATTVDGAFTDSVRLYVLAPSTEFNWALRKQAEGTGTPDGINTVDKLVDGNRLTRWSVSGFPQTATIDLNALVTITQTEVTCYEDRAYQYIIESSLLRNGPFTTIVDRSNNTTPGTGTSPIINAVDSVGARFVKITVTGADVYTGTWVSLTELRVFGEAGVTSVDNTVFEAEVSLFPNPATSIVTLESKTNFHTVSVYDQAGRILLNQTLDSTTFDVSHLPTGIYTVKLEGDDKHHVSKLQKQ